jgi:hypothetical protein
MRGGAYCVVFHMGNDQNSELDRKLQGRTLQVYLYLQKKKEPSGIREVQRDLELSSPSVAEYQVEKLAEMGIAARDEHGRVYIVKRVKPKALQSYVNFGRFTVPRLAFYASIFTSVAIMYAVFNVNSLNIYGIAVPAAAAGIFWFEAWKMWHSGLSERATKKQSQESDHFWAALAPGLGALAVFIAAAFFLFYYVEPNGLVVREHPPIDVDQPFNGWRSQPVTIDEYVEMSRERVEVERPKPVFDSWPSLLAGLALVGSLVTGFVVYLIIRCRDPVLAAEQE